MHWTSRRLRGVPLAILVIAAACGGSEPARTTDTAATAEADPAPTTHSEPANASDEATAAPEPTPGEDPGDEVTPAPDPTPTPESEPEPEPESAIGDATVVEVSYVGGDVGVVDDRIAVDRDTTVRVRITSDVAEHVHLHGYDIFLDIGAGETTELEFVADVPGVFELEFEDSHTFVTQFEVS